MKEPIYVSVSEIQSFLRCRQLWDYSSSNRQSLRHKTTPRMYLTEGTAIHKAIDTGSVQDAADYLAGEREAQIEAYKEENGSTPWPMELEEFDKSASNVLALVEQYHNRYGTDDSLRDQGLTYLGTEIPFKLDITDQLGWTYSRQGQKVYFCGTIDGIAIDEHGQIYIVENKTYSSKPDVESLQFHWQSMAYAVALYWLTGLHVSGVLYNGIAKRLIAEPKVLKSGLLSTDKRQATTLSKYLDAIEKNGEDVDDPRFTDILSHLRTLDGDGDTRFFYRELLFFQEEQLDAWVPDFLHIVVDMFDQPRIYRHIPYNGCGKSGTDCWFRDICNADHSDGDSEYILEQRYKTGTYGTVEAVAGKEPVMISSVDDLREYLRK